MGSRRTLRVDARAILDALTARDAHILGSYIDLRTGAIFQLVDPVSSGMDNEAVEAAMDQEPDRYVVVPPFDREYRLMCSFAEDVDDEDLATTLDSALRGKNAFRQFQHEIGVHGAVTQWRDYRREALVKWALDWLHSLNIDPVWSLPEPESDAPVAGLFHLLLLGERTIEHEVVQTRVKLADSADARRFFLRAARELCEFRGEPWRPLRGAETFEREDIKLVQDGAEILLEARVPAEISKQLG